MESVHAGVLKGNETQPYLRNLQLSSEISRRLQPISNIKSVHVISGFSCASDSTTLTQIRNETTRQPINLKKQVTSAFVPKKNPLLVFEQLRPHYSSSLEFSSLQVKSLAMNTFSALFYSACRCLSGSSAENASFH